MKKRMGQTRGLFPRATQGVRGVLHGQVSLAAVNQICVIHEAMNGCEKSKESLKDCFENVNIPKCIRIN